MISNKSLIDIIESGSPIRKMFELKERIKGKRGPPLDFALGNPDIKPPKEYYDSWGKVILESKKAKKNDHAYMQNVGYLKTRKKVALYMSERHESDFSPEHILMTVGVANGLDILMRAVLNPNKDNDNKDEIVCIAPYFVEYDQYIKNNHGSKVVAYSDENFDLDLNELNEKITKKTKAVLINSPNNPTGVVYSKSKLEELAKLLREKNKKFKKTIPIIEDAAYEKLVFGENKFNSILPYYRHTFYTTSFSKTLSLAGERIGYIAVHPKIGKNSEDRKILLEALPIILRTKVVNAPAIQQRIIGKIGLNVKCDIGQYERRINILAEILKENGFEFQMPQGTFYLWAKIPKIYENARDFIKYALPGNDPLFVSPGTAFGGEKYEKYVRFSVSNMDEEAVSKRLNLKFQEMCKQKLGR